MADALGYFIDWNGNLRSTVDPGEDFTCDVDTASRYVAVMTPRGALVHEATLYRTLEDIVKAGIKSQLVPGSVSWGKPD